MLFSYIRIDTNGQQYKEKIEADHLEDAKRRLLSRNIWYKSLRKINQNPFESFFALFRKKLSYPILAQLSRNLSIYLNAGIPLLSAIKLTANQIESKRTKEFLQICAKSLEEGNTLFISLEKQQVVKLPDFYKHALKVAEESGTLSKVLKEISDYLHRLDSVQKRINQALIYPLFIIILAIFMVSFMLSVVVPKITEIFTGLNQKLPTITQFVINLGAFLEAYWLSLFMVLIASILMVKWALNRFFWFRITIDKALLKIPIYKKILSSWELARFAYISSILLQSGITFIHAIKLAAQTISNSFIKREFEIAIEDVVEGKKLSQALFKSNYKLDNSFLQAIALGEETGEVSNVLKHLSELYLEENNDRINIFLSLLEPALILVVGLIIGVIVTAMLLPIFSMNFAM